MATQKKELTVEEKLKALYDLQQKLSEIDAIKILRGELPQEVQDLEDEIEGLNTRISKYQDEVAMQQDELNRNKDIKAKAVEQFDRYSSDSALREEWHLRCDAASASCDDGGVVATQLHRLVLVFHGGDCALAEEV